jgi:hypothetical protein
MSLRIDEKLKRDLKAISDSGRGSLNGWIEDELQKLVDTTKAEFPRRLNEARDKLKVYNELSMKFLELGPGENIKPEHFEEGTAARAKMDAEIAENIGIEHHNRNHARVPNPEYSFKDDNGFDVTELDRDYVDQNLGYAKHNYDRLRRLSEALEDISIPNGDIVDKEGYLNAAARERIYALSEAAGTGRYADHWGTYFGFSERGYTWENILHGHHVVSPTARARIASWLEWQEEELEEELKENSPPELRLVYSKTIDDEPEGAA